MEDPRIYRLLEVQARYLRSISRMVKVQMWLMIVWLVLTALPILYGIFWLALIVRGFSRGGVTPIQRMTLVPTIGAVATSTLNPTQICSYPGSVCFDWSTSTKVPMVTSTVVPVR